MHISTGGRLPVNVVLVLGFSNIFADAFSMGMGEYLSSKAHNECVMKERERESWYVTYLRIHIGNSLGLVGGPARSYMKLVYSTRAVNTYYSFPYSHPSMDQGIGAWTWSRDYGNGRNLCRKRNESRWRRGKKANAVSSQGGRDDWLAYLSITGCCKKNGQIWSILH